MSTEPHPRPGGETRPQPGGETRPEPGGESRPGPDLIERRSLSEAANAYFEAVPTGAGATTGALLVTGTVAGTVAAVRKVLPSRGEPKPKDE